MAEDVRLPRTWLALLLVVLIGSLMGVAFLLGRQTVPAPVVVATIPTATVTAMVTVAPLAVPQKAASAAPVAPSARQTVVLAASTPVPVPVVAPPVEKKPSAAPPKPSASAVHVSTDEHANAAVAAYFQAVDSVSPGQLTDDPEGFANQVVQGAMNGDTSGLDKLITQAEEGRQKLLRLKPPAPCGAYHKSTVQLTDDSIHVLRLMEGALRNNDANALTSVAGEAQAMQARAQQLKDQEALLKTRYGVR